MQNSVPSYLAGLLAVAIRFKPLITMPRMTAMMPISYRGPNAAGAHDRAFLPDFEVPAARQIGRKVLWLGKPWLLYDHDDFPYSRRLL